MALHSEFGPHGEGTQGFISTCISGVTSTAKSQTHNQEFLASKHLHSYEL